MLQTLKLLLPALIPSWRFFDWIAPSPRIEFARLKTPHDTPAQWREFRPRPPRFSWRRMLTGLLWNPRWNEYLFLVSCAERLMANPTQHSDREIFNRMTSDLARSEPGRGSADASAAPYLQYRLVFVSRDGADLRRDVTFTSKVRRYDGPAAGNERG
jgi:hypothetical protein